MTLEAIAISHEDGTKGGGWFVDREGLRLAEMTYVRVDENTVIIEHTQVHEKLQGKGVARRLLDAAVAWSRKSGVKLRATCSYARAQFDKDPSIRDVLG